MTFLLEALGWWILSALLSFISFPLSYRVFSFLPDKGLGLSKILGLLLSSYLIWLIGFVHYSYFTILIVWFGLAGLAYWLFQKEPEMGNFLKENLGLALVYESLFVLLMLVWVLVRMHHPEIVDQEKFMDFAFFNSIGRASHFPPYDPWLAGAKNSINYYYFGYFMMATFAKLSRVDPSVAYNLVIAFLFGLSGQTIFSLSYNLTRKLWPGFVGAAFLQVFGNLDGARQFFVKSLAEFDWWVSPTRVIHDVFHNVGGKNVALNAWWSNLDPSFLAKNGVSADAARDAAISEFPNFTFLHGDMHPHLVALPFALLALALGLNFIKNSEDKPFTLPPFSWLRHWPLAAFGLVLGCMTMMNTWDLPTYGSIASLCLLVQLHSRQQLTKETWLKSWLLPSVFILVSTLVFALPFLVFFKNPAKGIGFTFAKTGLRETLIFWGGFLVILLPFLAWRISTWRLSMDAENKAAKPKGARRSCPHCGAKVREGKPFCAQCGGKLSDGSEEVNPHELVAADISQAPSLAASLLKFFSQPGQALKENNVLLVSSLYGIVLVVLLIFFPTSAIFWLMLGLSVLLLSARMDHPEGLFTLILMAMGAAIIFGVEWVHLKDSFADNPSLARMNTVFKFYFQAWVLFSVAVPYALSWLIKLLFKYVDEIVRTAYLLVLSATFLAAACYPVFATMVVWGNYTNNSGLAPTLNGAAWLERDYPGDYQAILKLRQLPGQPVVAEAVGSEYTHFARVSSYTGLPTVVGWPGHELQWRGVYPGEAQQDVETLYSTLDPGTAQSLLKKYNISYVFVGALERSKYSAEQLNKFSGIMDLDPQYNSQGTAVFKAKGI